MAGSWMPICASASMMHLDGSVKHPGSRTGDPRGSWHASRGAAASPRHLPPAFIPQRPPPRQRLRAGGTQRQPRGGSTRAGDHAALAARGPPRGRHRPRAGTLGHRQHPGHAPGMRVRTLWPQPMGEANRVDGARQDLGPCGRPSALLGERCGHSLSGMSSGTQGQNLRLQGRRGAQGAEGPHRDRPLEGGGGPPVPPKAGLPGLPPEPRDDDLIDQPAHQGFTRGRRQDRSGPDAGERPPPIQAGRPQRRRQREGGVASSPRW
jgi:hypothetical protein